MLSRAGGRHTIKVVAGKRAPEDSHVHKTRRRRGSNAAYVPESEIEDNVEQSAVQRSLRRAATRRAAAMAADTAETNQKASDEESGNISASLSYKIFYQKPPWLRQWRRISLLVQFDAHHSVMHLRQPMESQVLHDHW